jgi:hypothetical protein
MQTDLSINSKWNPPFTPETGWQIAINQPVEFFIHEYTLYTVAVSLVRGSKERC